MGVRFADLPTSEIESRLFDIAVFACGYEKRCALNYSILSRLQASRVLVFEFSETKSSLSQIANKKVFSDPRFSGRKQFLPITKDDSDTFYHGIFDNIPAGKKDVSILVEYSSMPRKWYCQFLHYCNTVARNYFKIEIVLLYRSTRFSGNTKNFPRIAAHNATSNIFQFGDLDDEKPKMLFLGLGLDEKGAQAVVERLEGDVAAFYTKPGMNASVVAAVERNNVHVMRAAKECFTIPVESIENSIAMLVSAYNKYKANYTIQVASLGPKPMIVITTVLTLVHPKIGDFVVSSFIDSASAYSEEPDSLSLAYVLTFQ